MLSLVPTPPRPNSAADAQGKGAVIDLARARRRVRPRIQSRQDLTLALVGQLASLVRGTTSADRAGEVRKAASRALDLFELPDRGRRDEEELGDALRCVERLLQRQQQ